MPPAAFMAGVTLLVIVACLVTYYDVRYRRIPNTVVLATLICGFAINTGFKGLGGALTSLGGCLLGFGIMLLPHIFGATGSGDVKLFAAIGAVIGLKLVLPAFLIIVLLGGMLAIYTMVRARAVLKTMHGVVRIFVGMLPGGEMPRIAVPVDRKHTIPYGVAITFGSLISLFLFRF